ncbi:unnamed protein product [Coccothraustes coccothraustes]
MLFKELAVVEFLSLFFKCLVARLCSVSSQEDADSGQASTTTRATTTTEGLTKALPASTKEASSSNLAPSSTTLQTSPVVTTHTTVASITPAQSITTTTNLGTSSSPSTTSPTTATGTTPTTSETTLSATMSLAPISGQDSSSHSATNPKTTPAASTTALQQPKTTASLGGSGTTAAAIEAASSPGAAGTSSPSTEAQGNQPLHHKPNTTVSTTVTTTALSQSPSDCAVLPSKCSTKQPPSSASSPAQGLTTSTSPGSTKASVTLLAGSSSPTTTPMSPPGSKDTASEATTTTTPGTDQSTHDAGSASAKPTSASQSPAGAQPPAPGNQTDQAESCSSGHPQPNISFSNELDCKEQVQHTRPTIHLKEPRTCDEWNAASKNNSFYESFCSTAQHTFDASRDRCRVMLTACERPSHHWAVQVVLHLTLDSGEVLMELKEKKDRLEELGIINITSDKMVEDMTIKDEFSTPLIITIITLAGSLLLIAAIYGCHQRFSQKKDQRLTEEMQTMENGYHDNPTLEVMETSSEMQEKKVNLNGELGDSWIVPLDTLMKEDLEEEEDTHL